MDQQRWQRRVVGAVSAVTLLLFGASVQAQQSGSGGGDGRGTYSKSGKGIIDPCRNPERPDDAVDFRGNRCPPRGIGDDLRGRYNPDTDDMRDQEDTIMRRPGEPDTPMDQPDQRGTTNEGTTGGSSSLGGTGSLGNR